MSWRKFCGWALRKLGWTVVEGLPEEKKCIMLGVPHTTVWDFLIAYLYYESIGGKALCMVKKEMNYNLTGRYTAHAMPEHSNYVITYIRDNRIGNVVDRSIIRVTVRDDGKIQKVSFSR